MVLHIFLRCQLLSVDPSILRSFVNENICLPTHLAPDTTAYLDTTGHIVGKWAWKSQDLAADLFAIWKESISLRIIAGAVLTQYSLDHSLEIMHPYSFVVHGYFT